jgi:hypothetical protein
MMENEGHLDDTLVRAKGLVVAMMLVSRSTVRNWKLTFQFGRMTTPGDCKAWLKDRVHKQQPGTG